MQGFSSKGQTVLSVESTGKLRTLHQLLGNVLKDAEFVNVAKTHYKFDRVDLEAVAAKAGTLNRNLREIIR